MNGLKEGFQKFIAMLTPFYSYSKVLTAKVIFSLETDTTLATSTIENEKLFIKTHSFGYVDYLDLISCFLGFLRILIMCFTT